MSTFPDAPKLGRLQRLALEAIQQAGWLGLTADELAAHLRLDRCSIQPRTTELRRKGQIKDSGQRRLTKYRRPATVWIAA